MTNKKSDLIVTNNAVKEYLKYAPIRIKLEFVKIIAIYAPRALQR
jgi:hypothetical protein